MSRFHGTLRSNGVGRSVRWLLILIASAAFVACGGGDESSKAGAGSGSGSAASGAAGGTGTGNPLAAAKQTASAKAAQLTADGKSCIDLVKGARYAEAIAPCERALKDSANVASSDVQDAFDEAKAKVSEEAQKAATQAAADGLSGKDPTAAAKKSATDALGGYAK